MPGRHANDPRPRSRTTVTPGLAGFPLLLGILLASIVVLSATGDGRADLIFLKDGTLLQGKVTQEGETIADSFSGTGVWMPKGIFWVDDGARRIAFSPGQVEKVEVREYNAEHDIAAPRVAAGQQFLPTLREVVSVGPWDERWDRAIKVRCIRGNNLLEITVPQHLTTLTPHYARLDTLGFSYRWTACYLTQELGPDMVAALIPKHPDFKETKEMNEDTRAAKRFRAFHFLVQAGWFDHAEKELERIRKDLPGQSDKVETARDGLKKLRALQQVDDLKRARAAGQHKTAQKQLAELREEAVPERTLAEVRALRDQYEKTTEMLKQARRFLDELPKAIDTAGPRELFTAAAKSISEELDHDSVGRLEEFLGQAGQWERQKQQGGKPDQGPAELLALAVTGWLLGNPAAEAKVESAQRLWQARELALKHQKTDDETARHRLVRNYLAQKEAVGVEEMAQLIVNLPPPDPEEKVGATVVKLETRPAGRRRAITYHVQLPPEYNHGRPYPVLLVLHGGGVDGARDMLDHWSDQAARYGYILAAPEWGQGLRGTTYSYSTEEHAAVLDVLRDLRRRFHVDSDRVFLHGWGEGGSMAYDVGLSHPDLFAGVVPMGGYPLMFAQRYRPNAQYLPFYVVSGTHSGPSHAENRQQFQFWIPKGYPALFVERRGRGQEWFGGEVPYVFEWMKYKKRVTPVSEVGAQGREFQTMRSTDSMFYWLSTDAISPSNLNDAARWNKAALAATLWAHVNRENNQITVRTSGLRQLSIWLGRNSKGDGVVDFGAAVSVTLNGQLRMSGRVTPSMETLLEDLYQRGDRQRLFLARLDFNKL